jgi:hypothetical protein
MAASQPLAGKVRAWFANNNSRLLAVSIVSLTLLFFLHLFTATIQIPAQPVVDAVNAATLALVFLVAASIVWKGLVPALVCVLGVTLLHASVMLPYFTADSVGQEQYYKTTNMKSVVSYQSILVAGNMHFFLGIAMIAFSMVLAYRPSLLFARNRPEPADAKWSQYPIWSDNVMLADGRMEPSVPVKSLMTDQEGYLLWRYEYVLASVYGAPHLVRPQGLVPKGSSVVRDKESGRVMGKARYTGYFM